MIPKSEPTRDLYAKDAAEQLRRWDAGEAIWSIEMGGLGPGYEQAIQVLAIEIVRDNLSAPLPKKGASFGNWGDATVTRIDKSCGGFSGSQVGAAKQIAYAWLDEGPAALCSKPKLKDRTIQVSRYWPKAPEKE